MEDILFDSLDISDELIKNLNLFGFNVLTPIQEKTLPIILTGKDLIAQAKTGSGKTLSFGIGAVSQIDIKNLNPQVIILTPTRELSEQVAKVLREIGKYLNNLKIITLCGGVPIKSQVASLNIGVHIIVGTPGRIEDLISRDVINFSNIKLAILDEADHMLDIGFFDAIENIFAKLPLKRQSLFFSATYCDQVKRLANDISSDAIFIKTDTKHKLDAIKQHFLFLNEIEQKDAVFRVLRNHNPSLAIVFCRTKYEVRELFEYLYDRDISVDAFYGDLDQTQRDEVLLKFRNNSTRVLIATDLAARGLDINNIEIVINVGFPHKDEFYTHRIGRTARAGNSGMAYTLYTKDEQNKIDEIYSELDESYLMYQIDDVDTHNNTKINSLLSTLAISGGKKAKLRAGDILGFLCKNLNLDAKNIGKIDILSNRTYVAIETKYIDDAIGSINRLKIKKKRFKAWQI